MKRIGIYGGTFAPPHLGHLNAARAFRDALELDEVLIIPSCIPPHKAKKFDYSDSERLHMCNLAFGNDKAFTVSDMEIQDGGISYTYLTVRKLKREDNELYLLIGTDMLLSFDTWNNFQEIVSACTLCYVRRENDSSFDNAVKGKIKELTEKYSAEILPISLCPTVISSTEIRMLLAKGEDAAQYLPSEVNNFLLGRQARLDRELDALRERIRPYMSEKRYIHTLGVENAAAKLAEDILPGLKHELRCAALLHDIAKELPSKEQYSLALKSPFPVEKVAFDTEPALHSFAAPALILRDFAEYSSDRILSSVFKHTLGDGEMSVFDTVIFVADYIEQGRKYPSSILVREFLFNSLGKSRSDREKINALYKSAILCINETEKHLKLRGNVMNSISIIAKKAFEEKILQ